MKFLLQLFLITVTLPLVAEIRHDNLPLGSSPQRLLTGRIEEGQIIHCASGQAVTIDDIAAQYAGTDLFIIGEIHDNMACHRLQHDLINALYTRHPRLLVGFEFFQREDDPALGEWQKATISQEDLISRVEWYKRGSLHFSHTAHVLDAARKPQIQLIGLNIPRTMARIISRQGLSALNPQDRALFPTIDIPNSEHEYFIRSIFGSMAVQMPDWFTNLYAAQKAWDVIMAESMRLMLSQKRFKAYKGIIIAGSNHVAYKLGIPFRYRSAEHKVRILTLVPIQLPSPNEKNGEEAHPMMKMLAASQKPSALFSRGIADYVYAVPHQQESHFPSLGLSFKESDQGLTVTEVRSDSLAERNGIKKGDVIQSLDGTPVSSSQQFHTIMARKGWGEDVEVLMRKRVDIKRDTLR